MNNLRNVIGAAAVAALVSQPVLATEPAASELALSAAFGEEFGAVQVLDQRDMEQTSGKLAPLMLPLTIVAVDLALIGAFWGIYLPYTTHGPCHYCVSP
jgi:hypothetical protein